MNGERIAAWGVALTLLLTFPILGALLFGLPGLVIGLIIGLVFAGKPLQKAAGK
jgi:hypothetical protein